MKRYMGYYIDGIVFTSKQDIDNFLEQTAVERFKTAVKLFAKNPSMEASMWQTGRAETLVNKFGYTWSQVDDIEVATLKELDEERRACHV